MIFGGRLGEYRYYDMDQVDPRRPWREQGWKRVNDTFLIRLFIKDRENVKM